MLNFLRYFLGDFHVSVLVFYHVNLELLVYLDFQGIMILLLFVLLLNIYTLFFSLILSFFILLNVSFIVSFVSKLSFIFHLALLIVILISIFWYSWIVYFLFKYLSNPSPGAFRSKLRFCIFYNFLLSKKYFSFYIFLIFFDTNNFKFRNIIFLNYLITHSVSLSKELLSFSL